MAIPLLLGKHVNLGIFGLLKNINVRSYCLSPIYSNNDGLGMEYQSWNSMLEFSSPQLLYPSFLP